jgi:hypothetical protein
MDSYGSLARLGTLAAEPQDPAGKPAAPRGRAHGDGRQIASLVRGRVAGVTDVVEFSPSRVFLHDTNGIPVLTDLAALRDAVAEAAATLAWTTGHADEFLERLSEALPQQ